MEEFNMDMLIQKTILEMEKPFLLSDLFDKLKSNGIKDKTAILNILDELLNSGLVEYSDVNLDDDTIDANDDLLVYYQSALSFV